MDVEPTSFTHIFVVSCNPTGHSVPLKLHYMNILNVISVIYVIYFIVRYEHCFFPINFLRNRINRKLDLHTSVSTQLGHLVM